MFPRFKLSTQRGACVLELFADKITSKDEEERIFALRILTALEPEMAAQLAAAGAETVPGQSKVAQVASEIATDATARARKLPRVYIHIRDEADRPNAQAVASLLETNGFVVPGVERLVDRGPKRSELRFFRKPEGVEAADIAFRVSRDTGSSAPPR